MEIIETNSKDTSNKINRIAYAAFVILAAYFLITGDLSSFCIQFGIALVFDPFDAKVSWKDRPRYQRLWLIIHLVILLLAFITLIFGS